MARASLAKGTDNTATANTASSATRPAPRVQPRRLIFRTPLLATRLAALEACLRAGGRPEAPGCAPLRRRLDPAGQRHLRAFGAARLRALQRSRRPPSRVDMRHPLGASLMPPATLLAAEAFAEPFFRFATLDEALADLQLPAADDAAVRRTFAWFAGPLDQLCRTLRQRRPEAALAAAARWTHVDVFLGRLARFYGVSARLPRVLSVDLVWAPSDRLRATAWAGRAVVPVNRGTFPPATRAAIAPVGGFDRAALVRTLGVVVHEFGHVFASTLPYARRRAITDHIAGEAGVLNRRHANVLEEAVQTAIGQVLFLRSAPITIAPAAPLYAAEPGHAYPSAIDHLARRLAVALAPFFQIDGAGRFDGPGLRAALRAQVSQFGRPPLAFSRACWVWSDHAEALRRWRARWPGMRRREITASAAGGPHALPSRNPWLTRWLLSVRPAQDTTQLRSSPGSPSSPSSPATALRAAQRCLRGGKAACFVARRRRQGKGWDLAIAARSVAAFDRLLQALARQRHLTALSVPTGTPTGASKNHSGRPVKGDR